MMLRTIRSFVRRQGRFTPRQRRALEAYWPQYGLESTAGQLDWQRVFGRQAPRILEIGFGMGQSLASMAKQHPEQDFLGIEVHGPGVGALLAQLHEHNLTNVRVYQDDAVTVLQQCILDHSVTRIQLFFPDPWPKKRQHKRRIIQTNFIHLLSDKLATDGILHVVTDWQDYAEHALQILQQCPQLHNLSKQGDYCLKPDYRPITKYEQRAKRLEYNVYELLFQRVG